MKNWPQINRIYGREQWMDEIAGVLFLILHPSNSAPSLGVEELWLFTDKMSFDFHKPFIGL